MTRVMVVDDSRVSRMMIRNKIETLRPGWTLVEAASGEDALAQAQGQAPDHVTMDLNMAGMNGFEAAERLLALCPGVKIALLTANIQESSRERAQRLGVLFVAKPVTDAAVLAVVGHFESSAP